MGNQELTGDYFKRVKIRFGLLHGFFKEIDYANVIRV